jgi:hypothetical protein
VVFGRQGASGPVDLSTLDGRNGFRITGEAPYDHAGSAVSAAGDLNNDGFDDIVLGAPGRYAYMTTIPPDEPGASYVIWGRGDGFPADIQLASLSDSQGLRIRDEAGPNRYSTTVAAAGDVNGDGAADLAIGGTSGGYLLYGVPTGLAGQGPPVVGDWLV